MFILKVIDRNVQWDTVLSTVGVSRSGNYNDVMPEVLANRGNETYHYVLDDEAIGEFPVSGNDWEVFARP